MRKKQLGSLRRRTFLLGLSTFASIGAYKLAVGLKRSAKDLKQTLYANSKDLAVIGNAPLRKRAAAKGSIYGMATLHKILSQDAEFARSVVQECGMLSTEGDLKWGELRPSPDKFDFSKGDWLLEFAVANKMLFRGHTLVWHTSLPKWFKEVVNRQNVEKTLIKHISTVVGHYAGKMHSWDVVNEAIFPRDGRSDGLRTNSPWFELLGEDYIDLAFRVAAEADPHALLVYNDGVMDYDKPNDEAQRVAVLKLLERLKSKGTPVQALGIQAHLWANETSFNPSKLRNFLKEVADLGLKILITELDVLDKWLPGDIALRDRIVASAYEDYLAAVLDEPATIAVITWGLSDRYTWRSPRWNRQDGLPLRPLPLDSQMRRKLAWNGIARAFDKAPMRKNS